MDEACLDVELFIEEVKKYPEIWDTSRKEYHDRIKKRAAWFQVCEKFCEGFAAKPDHEKNDIGSKLMKRWKGIKDSYTKCEKKRTKSGQGAMSARRYIYARQLSFLANTVEPGPTQTSVDDEGGTGSECLGELAAETSTAYSEPPKNLDNAPASKRRRIIEDSLLKFMNTPITSATPEVPDDDKSFFESLLPAVRTLPLDYKLEFRCEVMKLLQKYRNMNQSLQLSVPQYSHQSQSIGRYPESNKQGTVLFTDSPTGPPAHGISQQHHYTTTRPSSNSSSYMVTDSEESGHF